MTKCTNCGADSADVYCARCGEKQPGHHDLGVSHFAHEVFHELAHVDSTLFTTLRDLITKPGFLTQEYFAGRKSRYIPPLRLFLTLFALQFLAFTVYTPAAMYRVASLEKFDKAGALTKLLEKRALKRHLTREDFEQRVDERLHKNYSLLQLLNILGVALVLKLLHGRRYLAEHLVFAAHFLAFSYIVALIVDWPVYAVAGFQPGPVQKVVSAITIGIARLSLHRAAPLLWQQSRIDGVQDRAAVGRALGPRGAAPRRLAPRGGRDGALRRSGNRKTWNLVRFDGEGVAVGIGVSARLPVIWVNSAASRTSSGRSYIHRGRGSRAITATTWTLSSSIGVKVEKANSISTAYTLNAKLATAPAASVVWKVNAFALNAATVTANAVRSERARFGRLVGTLPEARSDDASHRSILFRVVQYSHSMTTMPLAAVLPGEDAEIEAFERLKPHLARLWDTVFPGDKGAYTSVIIPSLSLDRDQMAKIAGAAFYEERLLFLLMRLRNPRARMIYVTSQPIHPMVLDYYLQLLVGIPASHARARLTLLCVYDTSPRSLTEKILERPRLMDRITAAIGDASQAYLTVFNATPLERSLAVRLGLPMNATDPRLACWGSKSGSRHLFREIGVDLPYGHEDLHSVDDIEAALLDVAQNRPGVKHALLKLNESFSGEGNARFTFPAVRTKSAVRKALQHLLFSVKTEMTADYLAKFSRGGGIVEEMLEAAEITSPSVQLRINPRRDVILSSTHEQILGGPSGQVYLGCLFPAADEYRSTIQDLGLRVGRSLAEKGVIGRFSVDFLASRDGAGESWHIAALEVNLRMGGTTHPMLALRFLTGGELDLSSGLLYAADGRAKYYRASDNVESEAYRGLLPEDLIDIVAMHQLDFSHRTSTGILFHMIGAISQFGKVGMIAIGDSREEADRLFNRMIAVLDEETSGRSHA